MHRKGTTMSESSYHPAAFALQALINQSNAVERELARLLGLSTTDFRALTTLSTLGPSGSVTMGQLASTLNNTPATTSALVDRLELAGYVARHRSETDRRQVTLSATPLSWHRIMVAMQPLMADADASVRALPEEHQRVVTQFLQATVAQLSRHLETLAAQSPP